MTLSGPVLDAWERPVTNVTVRVPLTAARARLPSRAIGPVRAFKCELYRDGAAHAGRRGGLPRRPPPHAAQGGQDSFFGGHVDLTPYNLALAEPPVSAGCATTVRRHEVAGRAAQGATAGNDGFVSAHQHQLDRRHRRARAMGSGSSARSASAAVGRGQSHQRAGVGGYASTRRRTTTPGTATSGDGAGVAPYIDTWESWNEPDSVFLITPPRSRPARGDRSDPRPAHARGPRQAGLKVTLVGPAVADVSRTLSRGVLKRHHARVRFPVVPLLRPGH